MNKKKRITSSGLFLLELIMAILIFALVSVVCVQFFAKSYLQSKKSNEIYFATSAVASVSEIIQTARCYEDIQNDILNQFEYSAWEQNDEKSDFYIYYSENFKICREDLAAYCVHVVISMNPDILYGTDVYADFNVYSLADSGNTIYSLDIQHHILGVRE